MASLTPHETRSQESASAEYLEDAIRSHPFCAGLKAESLNVLLRCATLERCPAHQLIFSEDCEADRLYLVHQGEVALELFVPGSGVVLIQTIHAGETCGISAVLDASRSMFTAETAMPSELISFAAETLRENAQRDAEFGNELMARLAPILFHRLRGVRQRLIEVYEPI